MAFGGSPAFSRSRNNFRAVKKENCSLNFAYLSFGILLRCRKLLRTRHILPRSRSKRQPNPLYMR